MVQIWGSSGGQKRRFSMPRQNRYFILTRKSKNKILKANFFAIFLVKILGPGTFEIAAKNGRQKVIFGQIC